MAENIKMYEIDGHHIRFKCCDNTLAILYNESDSLSEPKACPFCGMNFEDIREYDFDTNRICEWILNTPETTEATIDYECPICGHVISLRPAMIMRKPKYCPHCFAEMNGDN